MVEVASLGLSVNSGPVDRGTTSLRELTGAATRAETAVDGFNASTGQTAGRVNASTAAVKANTAALRAQQAASRAAMNNNRQLSFQLIDIGQALATAPTMGIYALQNLGFQVAQIGQLYMGRGGFNAAIRDSAKQVAGFVGRLGPLAAVAGTVGVAFAAAANEINKTSDVAVSTFDVMVASFQVVAERIGSVLQPAFDRLSSWWDRFTPRLMANLKDAANGIIGTFKGAYDFVVATWENFPRAMGDLVIRAADKAIGGVVYMLREAIIQIDNFTSKVNDNLGTNIGVIGANSIKRPTLNNPFQGEAQSGVDAFQNAFNTDYVGGISGDIANRAREIALASDEAAKGAGKAADAWAGLRKAGVNAAKDIKRAFEGFGNSIGGIFRGLLDKTMTWKDAALQAIQSVLQYLNQMNLAQGGAGLGGGGLFGAIFRGLLGFANGGVFNQSGVTPFANGGVVNNPTVFPFARGVGLMGEAGPEAIMPLQRGPDGKLGVAANSNNRAALNQNMMVEVHVTGTLTDENGVLTAKIDEKIVTAAPGIANAGANQAKRDMMPGGKSARAFQSAYQLSPRGRKAS